MQDILSNVRVAFNSLFYLEKRPGKFSQVKVPLKRPDVATWISPLLSCVNTNGGHVI